MPDLCKGYYGNGTGNTAIVSAILDRAPLNLRTPGEMLPGELFLRNFMPYAKDHWSYEGTYCNCEDLSRALLATWDFIRFKRKAMGPLPELAGAEVVSCLGLERDGIITKSMPVFQGPARGNVRNPDGALDGRCLFPIHYVCRIAHAYYDPTYDRSTAFPGDIVVRKLVKLGPDFWLAHGSTHLYVHNRIAAPGFGDSWDEVSATPWITAEEWKSETARTGHWRSGDLEKLDAALLAYEQEGGRGGLEPIRTAFRNWYSRNPKEAASRNSRNCVYRLILDLKLAEEYLRP